MTRATPTEAPSEPASIPLLHRLVSAGQLRYWIIGSWALALATEIPLIEVAIWFAVTMTLGVMRGHVERRAAARGKSGGSPHVLWAATVSCIAWAAAPLMAFQDGETYGAMLAIALLGAGYTLVFTQMRAAPREAFIVSTPYTAVLIWMVAGLWGTSGFTTLLGVIPVLGLALLVKVLITQLKDAEIRQAGERRDALIRELETARDRANAASQAKSNFLGVISHELRTPMNGVLGAAQLLSAGELAAQQRQFVSLIQQSGESLLTLLNDILDITKIEAGRMEIAVAETSLPELCRKVVGPFQAHAEAKGLGFSMTCDPGAPYRFRTDPLRVAQIVQNFLSNAIKFTVEGEVGLTIRLEDAGDRTGSARLVFTVTDQGIGIAPQDLDRLFQPFTQVDDSSTRRFSGTGLGLSIAKRMSELLGGRVSVTSEAGRGSAFTLVLDVEVIEWIDADLLLSEGAEATQEEVFVPLNILVVEDHPVNRMVLEAFLGPAGHAVTCATNGKEACDACVVQPFDFIIMDINMPVMDGLAAVRRIRAEAGPNQQTPIAVLSASARGEDHERGFEAGADAYLDKPVDFAALAEAVALAPGGRRNFQTVPAGLAVA